MISALFAMVGTIFLFHHLIYNRHRMTKYEIGNLFMLVSIAYGVHGILYFWRELHEIKKDEAEGETPEDVYNSSSSSSNNW